MKPWKKCLIDAYFYAVRMLLGVNRKKVVFVSFGGKAYSDNPRAISEVLSKGMPAAEIVWILSDPEQKKQILPENIRCVKVSHLWRACMELATASVYVNNFAFPRVPKSKKQLFIQTWHGDKAFKKVLNDLPEFAQNGPRAEHIDGYCDYAIAGSEYGKRQYRSAFEYEGEVLMVGTPRNDRLVASSAQEVAKIREELGVEEDTRILLYAPTLRGDAWKKQELQEINQLDISATLSKLEARDQSKWVCLMRAHPAVGGLNYKGADTRVVDMSWYEDMADLLLISDMLITDYSSCAGDFALTGRPIVLFQADKQQYLEKERTFYFNMEDSPYFIAETQAELETILSDMTEEKAKENCKKILQFYGDCETGHASETVAKIIKDWMER